jgi:hypothetical protein
MWSAMLGVASTATTPVPDFIKIHLAVLELKQADIRKKRSVNSTWDHFLHNSQNTHNSYPQFISFKSDNRDQRTERKVPTQKETKSYRSFLFLRSVTFAGKFNSQAQ